MSDEFITIAASGSKHETYKTLVRKRKECRQCGDVVNPSECADGKFDQHGHIGPWSDWQGNLDAEIMVVGQEWGGEENFARQKGKDIDSDATNSNLVRLMEKGLRRDLHVPSAHQGTQSVGNFFFTNAALCLRKGAATSSKKTKNDISEESFANCGRTLLRPQIELIQPRVALVLGQSAWNGLMQAFGLSFPDTHKDSFAAGPVDLNGVTMAVPLFHCGSKAHLNRPISVQEFDWNGVREKLEIMGLLDASRYSSVIPDDRSVGASVNIRGSLQASNPKTAIPSKPIKQDGKDDWGFAIDSQLSFLIRSLEAGGKTKDRMRSEFIARFYPDKSYASARATSSFDVFFSDSPKPLKTYAASRSLQIEESDGGVLSLNAERANLVKRAIARGVLRDLRGLYHPKDKIAINAVLERYGLPTRP
jgi:uracil-DNA glycosylase